MRGLSRVQGRASFPQEGSVRHSGPQAQHERQQRRTHTKAVLEDRHDAIIEGRGSARAELCWVLAREA